MELHCIVIHHRVLWNYIEIYGEFLWSSICQFSVEKSYRDFLWIFPIGSSL
jgi:hypothetical protein